MSELKVGGEGATSAEHHCERPPFEWNRDDENHCKVAWKLERRVSLKLFWLVRTSDITQPHFS